MQRSPSLVIAFSSFNEQLIPALLGELNPSRLFVINGIPPRFPWRAQATQEISESIIKEYTDDNPKTETGVLERNASTLDYCETFELLANIYRSEAYTNRLILAPIGSKMQAVACGLFRICCPDVHIEYPITESFFVPGFSSEKIIEIHELSFDNFAKEVISLRTDFGLDG